MRASKFSVLSMSLLPSRGKRKSPQRSITLKIAHPPSWGQFDEVLARIERARSEGLQITADMYPYPAGSTGLDAIMPAWVKEGGIDSWIARLKDPEIRQTLAQQMREDSDDWDNRLASGGADTVMLVAFRNPELKHLAGKTLAEVAKIRGKSAEETAMDLVIEDGTRVGAMYFNQSETVVRKAMQQPWVSFSTDATAIAAEGEPLSNHVHPRTYGTFPRVLGHYVRELQLLSLEQAVHRATGFPATNLSLRDRGFLRGGLFCGCACFRPRDYYRRGNISAAPSVLQGYGACFDKWYRGYSRC